MSSKRYPQKIQDRSSQTDHRETVSESRSRQSAPRRPPALSRWDARAIAVLGARPNNSLIAARVWLRAQLHHLPEQHQGHDDRRRFKIHRHRTHHAAHRGWAPGNDTALKVRPAAPPYRRHGQGKFQPLQHGHQNKTRHQLRGRAQTPSP